MGNGPDKIPGKYEHTFRYPLSKILWSEIVSDFGVNLPTCLLKKTFPVHATETLGEEEV
jgi:hypothetical protein